MIDKPGETTSPDAASVGVTPEIRVESEKLRAPSASPSPTRERPPRSNMLLTSVVALVGLAALGTSTWVYTEMQREMLRISTEMAQLRLSLDLYAQRGAAPLSTEAVPAGDASAIDALENRLAILEQNWRDGPAAPAAAAPAAALPGIGGPTASTESDGDCLPAGMRLLVASGDSYQVCGTEAVIDVMNVSNGYISLTDGTTVPSGSSVPLNGTACSIAVTSGGDEATTGFAEIRVTC